MIEKTITPTDGNETLTTATLYDDDSGETLGTGEETLKREKGASVSVRVEADGFIPTTETVSFQSSGSVEITLSSDEVTIDYRIADEEDELISSAELFVADTLASSEPEGSITLPYSEATVAICGRAEYYEDSCEEITLDESRELDLESARKTVTYTITPEIEGYEDWNANNTRPGYVADNTAYILQVGDSTWVDAGRDVDTGGAQNAESDIGEIEEANTVSVPYPAGPGEVEIYLRAVYFPEEGHEYTASDNNYLNVAEKTISVTREDQEINLSLPHIPACSDGVNNDFTDGIDQEDPGCMDQEGNYDPQDDVELLHVQGMSYGFQTSEGEVILVSGAQGEREIDYISPKELDPSINFAISVNLEIPTQVSENQSSESFALRFFIGSDENNLNNTHATDIVKDDGSDGWAYRDVESIDPDWFSNYRNYRIEALHATKVRGEDPTDGSDDVVLADSDKTRGTVLTWTYPPEHVEDNQQKQTRAKTTSVNGSRADVQDKQ
jgi:hypothetical protein